MSKITIVTGFFKINRESWQGFERTDEQYFEHFKVWAKLKNKLIVYVENESLAQSIIQFRASLGLEDMTVVNIINNCLELEPQLYSDLVTSTEHHIQQLFRLRPQNPEVWNPTYNYIMLLKSWCVCDAIKRNQADGMVAWIDFGYNHGGYPIAKSSDFSFEWKYEFPNKVNLFTIQDIDNRPIFEIVMSMDTYIMGGFIVAPASLWPTFWGIMKSSVSALVDCGLSDDDQNIMLMAYRKRPEICQLHKSMWSSQLKLFGGDHLSWVPGFNPYPSFKDKGLRGFVRTLKHKWLCAKYACRIYKHMSKIIIH